MIQSLFPKDPPEPPPTGPNDKDKLRQVPTFYLNGEGFEEVRDFGELVNAWTEYGDLEKLLDIHQKKAAALYYEK